MFGSEDHTISQHTSTNAHDYTVFGSEDRVSQHATTSAHDYTVFGSEDHRVSQHATTSAKANGTVSSSAQPPHAAPDLYDVDAGAWTTTRTPKRQQPSQPPRSPKQLYTWVRDLRDLEFISDTHDAMAGVPLNSRNVDACSLIGRGQFGNVYRMRHKVDHRLVALKVPGRTGQTVCAS